MFIPFVKVGLWSSNLFGDF